MYTAVVDNSEGEYFVRANKIGALDSRSSVNVIEEGILNANHNRVIPRHAQESAELNFVIHGIVSVI